jgi:hypothetical protein
MHAHIHALSGIRTHDTTVSAGEGNSCRRLSDHCNRLYYHTLWLNPSPNPFNGRHQTLQSLEMVSIVHNLNLWLRTQRDDDDDDDEGDDVDDELHIR